MARILLEMNPEPSLSNVSVSNNSNIACAIQQQHPSMEKPVKEQMMENALNDLEKCPQDDARAGDIWNSMGLIAMHMQADTTKAMVCQQEALRIFRLHKSCSRKVAVTLNDLGYVCEKIGKPDRALAFYKEAMILLINEKLDKSHPRIIATQRSLDRVCFRS